MREKYDLEIGRVNCRCILRRWGFCQHIKNLADQKVTRNLLESKSCPSKLKKMHKMTQNKDTITNSSQIFSTKIHQAHKKIPSTKDKTLEVKTEDKNYGTQSEETKNTKNMNLYPIFDKNAHQKDSLRGTKRGRGMKEKLTPKINNRKSEFLERVWVKAGFRIARPKSKILKEDINSLSDRQEDHNFKSKAGAEGVALDDFGRKLM